MSRPAPPTAPSSRQRRWQAYALPGLAAVAALGVGVGIGLPTLRDQLRERRAASDLAARLDARATWPAGAPMADCAAWAAASPLVLLVLGQSNAGNHGDAPGTGAPGVKVLHDGRCGLAADPLPGGTGRGGSIWSRLPSELAALGMSRPVVLRLLAVDATRIGDWVALDGPLRRQLQSTVADMRRLGLPPALVLWQQGEADARAGSSAADYTHALARLAADLRAAGVHAPLLLARSTRCGDGPSHSAALWAAQAAAMAADPQLQPGADTDSLDRADQRRDHACHLTTPGLRDAARLWAQVIAGQPAALH